MQSALLDRCVQSSHQGTLNPNPNTMRWAKSSSLAISDVVGHEEFSLW